VSENVVTAADLEKFANDFAPQRVNLLRTNCATSSRVAFGVGARDDRGRWSAIDDLWDDFGGARKLHYERHQMLMVANVGR